MLLVFSIAVYALEKQLVNIPSDTQIVLYHTCMTCSHAVYPNHGICLIAWIKAYIWDGYTPEQESFSVHMMINSSRSWVVHLSRDIHLLLQLLCPFFFDFWRRERLKVHDFPQDLNHVHLHVVEQLRCLLIFSQSGAMYLITDHTLFKTQRYRSWKENTWMWQEF